MPHKNILITGAPRSGKTTLIRALCNSILAEKTGFFTREILEKGRRAGFEIVTMDGRTAIFAHTAFPGPYKVGKYGVDVHALETTALPTLYPSSPEEMVIIDEIARMECFSTAFTARVREVLDSPNRVVATIALKGGGFIEEVKLRQDIDLIVLSERNRDKVADDLKKRFD